MTRTEFLKMCGILGITLPLNPILAACSTDDDDDNNPAPSFSGKVVIIGAGAAGMSAGYLLQQQGIEYEILEASPTHGGRTKTVRDFTDFPIPMGAEWLHVRPGIFEEIVNDPSIPVNVETVGYQPDDSLGMWNNGTLTMGTLGNFVDRKFVNGTWLDFFNTYVYPSVANRITFNQVVERIDYSGSQVVVSTADTTYTADKVIVAVPVKMLQLGNIAFMPNLPSDKTQAISEVTIWDGFKAFFEFSEKFYRYLPMLPLHLKPLVKKRFTMRLMVKTLPSTYSVCSR